MPVDAADVVVTGLTLSSRRVQAGDVYAALPGSRVHGATYAPEAVAAGAVAVLTDAAGADASSRAPRSRSCWVRTLAPCSGRLSARVYGDPAQRLTLMAVTGTQGKTTTTRLLEGGLTTAGVSAAVVGTVGTRIAGRDVETALTTPEAPDLQALFAVMVESGVTACAMEVSSHALVMGRVAGVVFDAAAFLNLGRDHLDFHSDVEDYFAAKASLFTPEHARRGLTNVDDPFGRRLLEEASVPMTTFSSTGADADWRAEDVVLEPEGSTFTVVTPDGDPDPGAGAADRRVQRDQRAVRHRPGRRGRSRPGRRGRRHRARRVACRAGSSGSRPARSSSRSSTTPTSPTPWRRRSPRCAR